MASDQQFCLRWNNHQSTLISVFDTLLENEKLVDCTLAADGQYLKAHKVVLSACSPYLEAMLSQHFDQHPILILKDVKYQELKAMLDYMYRGEVNISEEQLGHFLKAAESLQIKGLSDRSGGENGSEHSSKRQEGRKTTSHLSSPRSMHNLGHLSEQRKPLDLNRPKSPINTQEESGSPLARKRRRPNRPSSTDSNLFSSSLTHYPESYSEGNSSDATSSHVPIANTIISSTALAKTTLDNEQNESNSCFEQTGNIKPVIKTEVPHTLVQPKTELIEYDNEDSVEDNMLDEDEEQANISRPGPSFTTSTPGMTSWQSSADGSNDEIFLSASQENSGANQNSQDIGIILGLYSFQRVNRELFYNCNGCGRLYKYKKSLALHIRMECGQVPKHCCLMCSYRTHHKTSLQHHIATNHAHLLPQGPFG
uniref:BTB domain-containing protein n=1 Tax=Clastoptera arizonana TaxID=38151 RepID=A0A1B6CSR1_9HEMI